MAAWVNCIYENNYYLILPLQLLHFRFIHFFNFFTSLLPFQQGQWGDQEKMNQCDNPSPPSLTGAVPPACLPHSPHAFPLLCELHRLDSSFSYVYNNMYVNSIMWVLSASVSPRREQVNFAFAHHTHTSPPPLDFHSALWVDRTPACLPFPPPGSQLRGKRLPAQFLPCLHALAALHAPNFPGGQFQVPAPTMARAHALFPEVWTGTG